MAIKQLDKREAILRGTLELIAERGFHDTPMSKIAKNAKVSAGIIYHYFENKDDLIHALYDDVTKRLTDVLMQGNVIAMPFPQNLETVWTNAYRHYVANPMDASFLEQYKNSPYAAQTHLNELTGDAGFGDLMRMMQQDVDAGHVQALHPMVAYAMTLGVAAQLAKYHISGILDMSDDELQSIAARCAQSIAKV